MVGLGEVGMKTAMPRRWKMGCQREQLDSALKPLAWWLVSDPGVFRSQA